MLNYAIKVPQRNGNTKHSRPALETVVALELRQGGIAKRLHFFDDRSGAVEPPHEIDVGDRRGFALYAVPQDWSDWTGFRLIGEDEHWLELRHELYRAARGLAESDPDNAFVRAAELMAIHVSDAGQDIDRLSVLLEHVLGRLTSPYMMLPTPQQAGVYRTRRRAA